MLQTSQRVYDGRFLSRLGLGGSGGRGGHSAAADPPGGSFSPGGDGLSGRFIPGQIGRQVNKGECNEYTEGARGLRDPEMPVPHIPAETPWPSESRNPRMAKGSRRGAVLNKAAVKCRGISRSVRNGHTLGGRHLRAQSKALRGRAGLSESRRRGGRASREATGDTSLAQGRPGADGAGTGRPVVPAGDAGAARQRMTAETQPPRAQCR